MPAIDRQVMDVKLTLQQIEFLRRKLEELIMDTCRNDVARTAKEVIRRFEDGQVALTSAEPHGLTNGVELGLKDQEEYFCHGGFHADFRDYGDEMAETARTKAIIPVVA